jgi:transcriptional regulator with XRE-family HTH domain
MTTRFGEEYATVSARESDVAAELATRVLAARARLGWSRETLAHHTGLSWAAVAQIETGRRTNVRPATLTALAAALGLTVDYLLGRDGTSGLFLHRAVLYGSEEEFAVAVVPLLRGGVERSEALLVVTTGSHIRLLRRELGPDAAHIRFQESSRWLRTPLHALAGFRDFVQEGIKGGSPWVGLLGEPIWKADEEHVRRWIAFEAMFNLVFATQPVTLLCPYDTSALPPTILDAARTTHPFVLSSAGTAPSPAYREPEELLLTTRQSTNL